MTIRSIGAEVVLHLRVAFRSVQTCRWTFIGVVVCRARYALEITRRRKTKRGADRQAHLASDSVPHGLGVLGGYSERPSKGFTGSNDNSTPSKQRVKCLLMRPTYSSVSFFLRPACRERCPDPERIARGTAQLPTHENQRTRGFFRLHLALLKGVSRRSSGALGLIFSAPLVHRNLIYRVNNNT